MAGQIPEYDGAMAPYIPAGLYDYLLKCPHINDNIAILTEKK